MFHSVYSIVHVHHVMKANAVMLRVGRSKFGDQCEKEGNNCKYKIRILEKYVDGGNGGEMSRAECD